MDIYKYALKNNEQIKNRKTLNYEFYNVFYYKKDEDIIELVYKCKTIFQLEEMKVLFNKQNYLIEIIEFLFDEDVSYEKNYEQWDIYINHLLKKECLYIERLILISLLIATRIENNLLLALSICLKYKNDSEDMQIIILFISRYFLFYNEIIQLFNTLKIKNTLTFTYFYLWSDVFILLNIKEDPHKYSFLKQYYKQLRIINNNYFQFIEDGKFSDVLDLLILKEKYDNFICKDEIEKNKIMSTQSETDFSSMLGDKCSFLFGKILFNQPPNKKGILANIYNLQTIKGEEKELLQNKYRPIKEDDVSYDYIRRLYNFQLQKRLIH